MDYAAFFREVLTLDHLSRWAAAIFFRAATDIGRLFGTAAFFVDPAFPFSFAHLSRCASAIRARPAADILLRPPFCFPYTAPNADRAAEIPWICLVSRSCSFFNKRTTPANCVMDSLHLLAKLDCLSVDTGIRTGRSPIQSPDELPKYTAIRIT